MNTEEAGRTFKITFACGCVVATNNVGPEITYCKDHAVAKTTAEAVRLFNKGWSHFLECLNFEESALDSEAICWMNEISIKTRELSSHLETE